MTQQSITSEQAAALDVARDLVRLGMPMFLAQPDPDHFSGTGYALPAGWQQIAAEERVVDAWRPGMALCAVTGHVLDLVDLDPRSGGVLPEGITEIPVLGRADTPSGGQHLFVLPIGVASRDGAWPGVDVKSGEPDGQGRGFAFLAPTVRRSKVDGQPRVYTWSQDPVPDRIRDALNWVGTHPGGNAAAEPIRRRIAELRAERMPGGPPRRIPRSVARAEWDRAYDRLVADLRTWASTGWGGAAHAGLLAHTTHLARLAPSNARAAYEAAFAAVGLVPDGADLAKLDSALSAAVPDVVVADEDMPPGELFWAGARVTDGGASPPGPEVGPTAQQAGGGAYDFAPVTRERYRQRRPAPSPTLGAFGGEGGHFYASGVHWLQGESESGKSWVALALVAEVLGRGERACYVDYEHTPDAILERLECLGVTDEGIERLTLVDGTGPTFGELVAHVRAASYDLMVVDGVTSSLSSAGLSGRDEQELTRWADLLPRAARMAVCVDHVVKAVDERRGMAVGTQAKKSVVTGSAWEVVGTVKFGRGSRDGVITLNLQKDKPGGLRGRGVSVVRLRVLSDAMTGTVEIVTSAALKATPDQFFADQPDVRADAVYEQLVSWDAAGGAIPPKMQMETMRKLVRDELNLKIDHTVMDKAIRTFKRNRGLPIREDDEDDC